MKELREAKKTLLLGIIIAVVILIIVFYILDEFGCFGCNMCSNGAAWSCFEACTDCMSCACGCGR